MDGFLASIPRISGCSAVLRVPYHAGGYRPIAVIKRLWATVDKIPKTDLFSEHMAEKITKLEIARRQIDTAIELLFAKKDLCSVVTLAAAGEEILGRLLGHQGKQHALDRMISDTYAIVKEIFPDHESEMPSERYLVEKANYARNHLKHLDRPESFELELELFSSAFGMLVRAVENYKKVNGDLSEPMKRFNTLTERVQDKYEMPRQS